MFNGFLSNAQETVEIFRFNLRETIKNVFKCAPSISKSHGGESPAGYDMLAYCAEGIIDWGGAEDVGDFCRFGNDNTNDIIIYYGCEIVYTSGTIYYVGPTFEGRCPGGYADENGNGRCYNKEGELIYEGKFNWGENMWASKPIGTYPNKINSNRRFEMLPKGQGNLYLGETLNGKEHGWGLYIWENGDCLYGKWENGIKKGYGMKKISSTCTIITLKNWNGIYIPENME